MSDGQTGKSCSQNISKLLIYLGDHSWVSVRSAIDLPAPTITTCNGVLLDESPMLAVPRAVEYFEDPLDDWEL